MPRMIQETTGTFQATTDIPERVWEAFVAAEPGGNFLQTAAWGNFKSEWGWRARRVAIRHEGILVAGAQVLFRPLPLGRSIAYIPRGPVAPEDQPGPLVALLGEVHRLCRAEGALLLTIEPPWPVPRAGVSRNVEAMKRSGFRPAVKTVQPGATIILDIRPSEDEILAQMHQKWRYNIRLAERKDVTVRAGGEGDFELYHALTSVTGQRDDFATRPRAYYEDVWRAFQPERSRLLIAEYAGKPLAAILVVRVGKTATYLYGASSNEERNRMPNHALQWAAIQWAREEGCDWYDLWGIPDEVPVDGKVESYGEGGLWGVFRFKQGFGGEVVHYPGAWDFPYSRIAYLAYRRFLMRRAADHG
jgi:peptidoglycan pentaglycine glycine transferase (the first glycine)